VDALADLALGDRGQVLQLGGAGLADPGEAEPGDLAGDAAEHGELSVGGHADVELRLCVAPAGVEAAAQDAE
jgi:hypothetical protein